MNCRQNKAAIGRLIAPFAAAVLLSGCYESAEVSLHSPGVYRGKADSAAILAPDADARAALISRLRAGQTDR